MITEQLKRRMINSASSLMNKYDMFYTNRQYATMHFKTEEEYKTTQKSLATEIQLEENITRDCLEKYFSQNFPKVKLLLFDSRPICLNDRNHRLGVCLFQNLSNDENDKNEILRMFKNDTDMTILVNRFEELDDESQKKIMEYLKK